MHLRIQNSEGAADVPSGEMYHVGDFRNVAASSEVAADVPIGGRGRVRDPRSAAARTPEGPLERTAARKSVGYLLHP